MGQVSILSILVFLPSLLSPLKSGVLSARDRVAASFDPFVRLREESPLSIEIRQRSEKANIKRIVVVVVNWSASQICFCSNRFWLEWLWDTKSRRRGFKSHTMQLILI
jgi:hypothetical protein